MLFPSTTGRPNIKALPGWRGYPALGDCGRDRRGGPVDHGLPRLVGVQRVVDRVGVPRRGRHRALEKMQLMICPKFGDSRNLSLPEAPPRPDPV